MNTDAARVSDRAVAAALQAEADQLRDERADGMHRIIRATGDGWVEIQAEYLAHLIDRLNEADRGC